MAENEIAIDKDDLKNILNQIEELKINEANYIKERLKLYEAAIKTFEVIGMAENGKIKVKTGGLSFKDVLSGAKGTINLLIQAGFSKKAEEKLAEKFSYFKEMIPLFEKIEKEING